MLLDREVFSVVTHAQRVSVPGKGFVYSTSPRGDVGCPHVLPAEGRVRQKPSASVAPGLGTCTQSAACAVGSDKLKRSAAPAKEAVMILLVVTDVPNALQVECVKTVTHATTAA